MLRPTIALLGNPNSGKTTLFNHLTGRKQPVGNWSGVTVTAYSGKSAKGLQPFEVIDLPGTYSLTTIEQMGASEDHDENVPASFLNNREAYTFILNVVDATCLERHLYLTLQAREMQLPMAIMLNRLGGLQKQGKTLSIQKLETLLGCPVVDSGSFSELLANQPAIPTNLCVYYPRVVEDQIVKLSQVSDTDVRTPRWQVVRWLEGETPQNPVLAAAVVEAQTTIEAQLGEAADVIIAKSRYDFIDVCLKQAFVDTHIDNRKVTALVSEKLDAAFCHRFWGLPLFLGVMYVLFTFAIGLGGYFQKWFEWASQWLFVSQLSKGLAALNVPNVLEVMLVQGVGQALSTLATFIPVIGAMFFALAFLEDSGYMARAAFVMDRLMRAVGLPGKSFVPMIVGFGCNVPAILGTRTLDNRRDRILAVMMSPFMSCGARLAIFTVFAAAFFPQGGQNIVFLLYVIGIAMAVLTGLLLKNTILKGNNSPFILEVPRYQWPRVGFLGRQAWHRLKRFLVNAGKLIVPVCMVIGLSNQITLTGDWVSEANTQDSVLSIVGQKIVPVFEPMGLDEENWPAAVGLLTGLMAKEVVIGTLNTLYTAPNTLNHGTYGEMVERFQGQANAFAYLLFVLLYFPCMSATAAMLKEVQKGWTLFSVCWTTGLAYGIAVGFYQCATFVSHPLQSIVWLIVLSLSGVGVWLGLSRHSRTLGHKVPTRVVVT